MFRRLIRFLYAVCGYCPHDRVTWVFQDTAGLYQQCLDCGERLSPAVDFSHNRADKRVLVRIESTERKHVAQ